MAPLSLALRKTIHPTDRQKEILNGVLVAGGGKLEKNSTGVRIRLEFGEKNQDYGTLLGSELASLTSNPSTNVNRPPHTRTGKVYISTRLGTITLPSLQPFYDRFMYEGRRVIPNDVGDHFSALSLAY